MGYTIDIDTGGTFTDGFFVQGDTLQMVKVPTTPHDLTECFMECIKAGAAQMGLTVEDLLYATDIIRFSNTIGTNTIIQRDGSKIGLLVTKGREHLAPTQSDDGKEPLVSPDMVIGIEEEMSPEGEVAKAPDRQAVLEAAQRLIDQGARCLVVALAFSDLNSASERSVRKAIKDEYPRDFLGSMPVFLSSDVSRRSGESERVNAAVINAYIHAKLVSLLYKAGEKLRSRLYGHNLFIVHNNGSVARVARTRAINTYNSGPAAGLLGARLIGSLYGAEDLVSMDMGGTSFDLGYVKGGKPSFSLRPDVEGMPVNLPMLSIKALGAGGGSIASVKDGKLKVGPQSAGALPGPVCFDLGGSEPTVTDADLILGYLDPDFFLGGKMKLNLEKARQVMKQKVADPLGISVEEAALAVKTGVDQSMGRELAEMLKGLGSDFDPLLVVYGGGGPTHSCHIGHIAGLKRLVVTPFSSVFSAFSSSSMDVGHIYYRRVALPLDDHKGLADLAEPLANMQQEALRDMRGEGFSQEEVSAELELLVSDPSGEREVKISAPLDFFTKAAGVKAVIKQASKELSKDQKASDKGLMLTTMGLVVSAPVPRFPLSEQPKAGSAAKKARKGSRPVFWEAAQGSQDTPIYDFERLGPGHELVGPAVVESPHTTVLVPSGWKLSVDKYGNALCAEGA